MRPLAIIERDGADRAVPRATIEAAGFRTEFYTSAADALTSLRQRPFALAIIAIDRSDAAFELCRQASELVPVIALAPDPAAETCVRAFDSGADDCVARTVPPRELIARVRNVLRRTTGWEDGHEGETLLAQSLLSMRVRNGHATYDLTLGEAQVLRALMDEAPRPITPLALAQRLQANRGTIESRLQSLRNKLGPEKLISRGRLGYQLVEE